MLAPGAGPEAGVRKKARAGLAPDRSARLGLWPRQRVRGTHRKSGHAAQVSGSSRGDNRLSWRRDQERGMQWLLKKKAAKKKATKKEGCEEEGRLRQGAVGPWRRLDFEMQEQEQTKWCSAAAGASVALYYDPHAPWTQCRVANGLRRNDCCGNGAAGPCNRYSLLVSVSYLVECLNNWDVGNSATFQQVRTEIDHKRPLCFRVVWNCGGAHCDHRWLSAQWRSGRQDDRNRGSVLGDRRRSRSTTSRRTTRSTATGPTPTTRRTEEDNDGNQDR